MITKKHLAEVEALLGAHVKWLEQHAGRTFAPLAVIEAHLKAAATCCIGVGMNPNEAADLIAGFAEALRLQDGEPDPTRPELQ